MSTANPLNFFGGMILELGAAIGLIALLWQSPSVEAQPQLPITSYYSPVVYPPSQLMEVARYEPRREYLGDDRRDFTERSYYPSRPAMSPPLVNRDRGELLPPAPAFNPLPGRAPHVAVARPLVRPLRVERFETQPSQRTAQSSRGEYDSRY